MSRCLLLFVMHASACTPSVTEPGKILLQFELSEKQGGAPAGLRVESRQVIEVLAVNPQTDIEVRWGVSTASGARYLEDVAVVVQRADGEVWAAVPTEARAINVGTVEAPVASLPLQVGWKKASLLGTTSKTLMFNLVADGRIQP